MTITQKEDFFITGIAVRTSNEKGQSSADIPKLWHTFFAEQLIDRIPGKIRQDIYCVYTDYEKDFTKPYTTVLGCRVDKNAGVPEGCINVIIHAGKYELFTAKGNIQEGIVFNEWTGIWNSPLKRTYQADFEVYGAKAQNMANAEVDIFVGIK